MLSRWILALAFLAALAPFAMVGCAGADGSGVPGEAVGSASSAIYGGVEDDDATGASGTVALRIGDGPTFELCSGALVAPNVVLTARHCVGENISTKVSCDENGKSTNGNQVARDVAPETIHLFVGASPTLTGEPAANGLAIFHPEGKLLCDSDIALLTLDRPITSITPMRVRLDAAARPGETITTIGYGQNDDKRPIGTRFRKAVSVLAVGKGISPSHTPLGAHEFEVGVSICQGDSGGPAISEETGAVVGVVSRGGDCSDDFGHIFTTATGFSSMFARAFAAAGGAPTAENGEVVDTWTGASSADTKPAPGSAANVDAPQGPGAQSGCAASPVSRGSEGGALVALFLLPLAARRRR